MCDKLATWDITYGRSVESYIQSCDEHLAETARDSVDCARAARMQLSLWPANPQEGHEPATCCHRVQVPK